jgi:hypothetical protein
MFQEAFPSEFPLSGEQGSTPVDLSRIKYQLKSCNDQYAR